LHPEPAADPAVRADRLTLRASSVVMHLDRHQSPPRKSMISSPRAETVRATPVPPVAKGVDCLHNPLKNMSLECPRTFRHAAPHCAFLRLRRLGIRHHPEKPTSDEGAPLRFLLLMFR